MATTRGVVFLASPRAGRAVPNAPRRPPWPSSSSDANLHTQQPAHGPGPRLTPQGSRERERSWELLFNKSTTETLGQTRHALGEAEVPPATCQPDGTRCGSFFPTSSSEPSLLCWPLGSPGNISPTGGLLQSLIWGPCVRAREMWLVSPAAAQASSSEGVQKVCVATQISKGHGLNSGLL